MSLFTIIIFGTPLLTLVWWGLAHWQLRVFRRRTLWRVLLGIFVLVHLAGLAWFIAGRRFEIERLPPGVLIGAVLLWFIVTLPLAWLIMSSGLVAEAVLKRGKDAKDQPRDASRRKFLTAALVAAPPLLQTAGLARGMSRLDDFRVRRVDAAFANLPRELEGARIAHVTDSHAGRFVDMTLLRKIAAATNDLRADAIMFTGDLIDYSLNDFPNAIACVKAMDARGVWLCEGNHDLFDGHAEFEDRVRAAGVNLLLNEERALRIRGVDVQLLGQRWGLPGGGRNAMLQEHGAAVARLVDPRRFSMLLAHHPHAFDAAAAAGIDLTLAGHTHGGQLNIWPGVGPGSMMFKYVSGLYRQAGVRGKTAACVVSNGVGNWFPLRLNAPAEIVEITLRRV